MPLVIGGTRAVRPALTDDYDLYKVEIAAWT